MAIEKAKKIARGLKLKWAVPIGATTALLTKMGFGKALAVAGGPPGIAASIALDAPMLIDAAKTVKEDIIDPVVVEPAAKKMVEGENILKKMFTPNMNQGGIMNMDDMIRPIGMAGGGDFKDQLKLEIIKLESTIKSLMADEVLTGTDNSRAIQGNQNLLEYYRSLR